MSEKVNLSIVLYQNDFKEIQSLIDLILKITVPFKLYLIDNSPSDGLRVLKTDPRIEYIFNNGNLGYGAGHNIAIKESIEKKVPFHLVLNPDVKFEQQVIEKLLAYSQSDKSIGNVLPKVYYENGDLQRIVKLLPTPFDVVGRRFFGKRKWAIRRNDLYELKRFDYKTALNAPCLSGCFMLLRTEALEKVGLFDEKFFMYFEDFDLNRRIHRHYKTMFYPEVSITHGYRRESTENRFLLKKQIESAIYYFNKWGWLFDKERERFNIQALEDIGEALKTEALN